MKILVDVTDLEAIRESIYHIGNTLLITKPSESQLIEDTAKDVTRIINRSRCMICGQLIDGIIEHKCGRIYKRSN